MFATHYKYTKSLMGSKLVAKKEYKKRQSKEDKFLRLSFCFLKSPNTIGFVYSFVLFFSSVFLYGDFKTKQPLCDFNVLKIKKKQSML